ncbi:MAG: alpha/beta fold hydrolase [Leptolyngbyaceae cyanobacterium]
MEPLFWPNTSVPVRNLRRQLKHGQLFWREVGRGQTVVFLHGSWHDGDQWSDVLALLGQKYHCLALDLIGFGESWQEDKSTQSVTLQVNALSELLESLRLDSVVLVGHSLGAWVAARYALQYPQQVKGLCLLEPEGFLYEPKRWQRERWLASPLAGLWLAITKPFARKPVPGASSSWLQSQRLRTQLKRYPTACRLLFQRRRKDLEAEAIGSQLSTADIPMVVLQGKEADVTSQRLGQTAVTASPKMTLKVLPGSDELPSYEAAAVADFLEQWLTAN